MATCFVIMTLSSCNELSSSCRLIVVLCVSQSSWLVGGVDVLMATFLQSLQFHYARQPMLFAIGLLFFRSQMVQIQSAPLSSCTLGRSKSSKPIFRNAFCVLVNEKSDLVSQKIFTNDTFVHLISVAAASPLFWVCGYVCLYSGEFIMQTHRIMHTTMQKQSQPTHTYTQSSTNANIKRFENRKTNYFANYLISVL